MPSTNDDENKSERGKAPQSTLSVVDRSIQVILPSPDQTPSRRQQPEISARLERLHRLHGTSLIHEACRFLRLEGSTYATACTILHRFYHRASLRQYDCWSVAMASMLLAAKLEEEDGCSLHAIIAIFAHIYRKRVVLLDDPDEQPGNRSTTGSTTDNPSDNRMKSVRDHPHILACELPDTVLVATRQQRQELLKALPPISKFGPAFDEWKKCLTNMEHVVLRELGFTLHWISDSHPHKFIPYFLQALGIGHGKVSQVSWSYSNDSCRLDLCVRYPPETIACAAIHLATLHCDLALPLEPKPWWEPLCGAGHDADIATIANAILGLDMTFVLGAHGDADTGTDRGGGSRDQRGQQHAADIAAAEVGFIRPLVSEGCFNDVESFVWYQTEELLRTCAPSSRQS